MVRFNKYLHEGLKLYLDDERKAPSGWKQVRWPDEMIKLLKKGGVDEISLDHDLGDDDRGTGYDVILWIEKEIVMNNFNPPKIKVHSANTSARKKMEQGIQQIHKLKRKNYYETI